MLFSPLKRWKALTISSCISCGAAIYNNCLPTAVIRSQSHSRDFYTPMGIAVSAAGKICIADIGNYRIVEIDDMSGAGWAELGDSGNGVNQFDQPWGVAYSGSGKLDIADWGNDRIVRIDDITGAGWTVLGEEGTGENQYLGPAAIAVK